MDPIGLAGGLNLYGYAGGDPVNFSDPFGLKVCFEGSPEEVEELRSGMEDATNTAITLDKRNCVRKATRREGKGFESLQRLFFHLIAVNRTHNVRYGQPGEAFYSTYRNETAIIMRTDVGGFRYPVGQPFIGCYLGGVYAGETSLGMLLAHELLGHGTGSGEAGAVGVENQYHAAKGETPRCQR